MALNNLSYGWTPDSVIPASGGFGNANSAALPRGGATLASNMGLNRSYPSWLNQYGYQGSLNTYTDPTFGAGAVDPFMQQVADAQAKTAAAPAMGDTTGAGQQPTPFDPRTMGGEMNAAGGQGNGEFPSMKELGAIPGQVFDAAKAFGGAVGDMFGGGSMAGPGLGDAPGRDMATGAPGPDLSGPGGATQFFHGGLVTPNKLGGPNPAGPDDGYASLDIGEGVLTAAALKHYGPGIVARLNKLAVPKGALGGK